MRADGIWMKYAPNSENANARKIAVIRRFTQGFAASLLTPPAPKRIARDKPSAVKVSIIPNPYMSAEFTALRRLVFA
jgi:hypothetical protein